MTHLRADTATWPAPPRVAYAVSRRVGPAVVRNRVRRRLRSAIRGLVTACPELVPPGAYLIAVSPQAANRSQALLEADLRTALTALRRTPPAGGTPR